MNLAVPSLPFLEVIAKLRRDISSYRQSSQTSQHFLVEGDNEILVY